MSRRREVVALIGVCATLYLVGAGDIPFYTRGEPREGMVVQEMLRTGRWLVPARPEGEPARKPPLYYWSAAPFLAALPEQPELALRLPSALFGTGAVIAIWATARAAFGAPAGLPAALVLASAFEWTRAATSARVDMALGAAMALVLAGWMLALVRGGAGWLALAIAGTTLGVLAKGPVALVLPGLAAGALALGGRESARRLRPFLVLGVAAALAALWYAVAFQREGAAFLDVVGRENLRRFFDAEAAETGHAHGVGYLVPLGLVGLLPWTPVLALAIGRALVRPRTPATTLVAAWAVGGVIFFSLAAGKRSVYLLPLYPAIALLFGAAVAEPPGGRAERIARLGATLYAPAALLLAAIVAGLALGVDPGALLRPWLKPPDAAGAATLAARAREVGIPLLLLALATAAGAPAFATASRGPWRRLVVLVAALMVTWTAAFDGLLHPAIGHDRSLKDFLGRVHTMVPPDAVLYVRYPPDPGLRFYAPRPLRPLGRDGVPVGGAVLLWEDDWRRLRDASGRSLPVRAVSTVAQTRRGHLALVTAPEGPLRSVPEAAGPPQPPGFRTGS